jgi:flagellar hook protein FlgE
MMRSLYSGVAGLKTHQTKMDVIGNNIANVNTTAYKSSSITFTELMSQTTQKASGANATTGTGGVNARQIGLGVKSGAINVNISTQGSAQSTGNPFDIMITGDNFFVVNNGNGNYFTRDGSFYVDGAGNLAMTSTGYNVMGWGVDDETGDIKQDTVTALRIMSAANLTYPPEATSKAYVSGILDKNDTDVTSSNGKAVNLNFYDNLGYSYTARLVFKQSSNTDEYSVEMTKLLDSEGNELDISGVKFGTTDLAQANENTMKLISGYAWNGKVLQKGVNDVVDVSKSTTWWDANGDVTEDGQKALDALAEAYGYEGSTDDFLNQYITSSTDGTIGDMLKGGPFEPVNTSVW